MLFKIINLFTKEKLNLDSDKMEMLVVIQESHIHTVAIGGGYF